MRPTFRSLEAPLRIGPLALVHWVYVLIGLGALWAFVKFGPLPAKPALAVGAFLITSLAGPFTGPIPPRSDCYSTATPSGIGTLLDTALEV